jgi:hypothetical protein
MTRTEDASGAAAEVAVTHWVSPRGGSWRSIALDFGPTIGRRNQKWMGNEDLMATKDMVAHQVYGGRISSLRRRPHSGAPRWVSWASEGMRPKSSAEPSGATEGQTAHLGDDVVNGRPRRHGFVARAHRKRKTASHSPILLLTAGRIPESGLARRDSDSSFPRRRTIDFGQNPFRP